jgi:hypothetical protein
VYIEDDRISKDEIIISASDSCVYMGNSILSTSEKRISTSNYYFISHG